MKPSPKHNPGSPEQQASTRQEALRSAHDALNQRKSGIANFPVFLEECIEGRIWEQERRLASGRSVGPISLREFVHEPFPVGLGSDFETIERIIGTNEALLQQWANASGRKPTTKLLLDLKLIRRDGGTQSRDHLSDETVADYAESYVSGASMPPVVAFYDGSDYWLADGFHRCAAAEKAGAANVLADVRQGSQRDAILFSVGANGSHGLRRTNADKRRAVELLLHDEEWSRKSDRWIAERCAVHHEVVSRARKQLAFNASCEGRIGQDGKVRRLPVADIPSETLPFASLSAPQNEQAFTSTGNERPSPGERVPFDGETSVSSPLAAGGREEVSPLVEQALRLVGRMSPAERDNFGERFERLREQRTREAT